MSKGSRFEAWVKALQQGEASVYVVAEMANAHDGSLEKALEITRRAAQAGADAIKYQRFTAAELLVPEHSMYEVFAKLEMLSEHWDKLISCARETDLDIFCDVFGYDSAEAIGRASVTGFKVHASEVPNEPLLKVIGSFGTPVLLSCAGASWIEVGEAIETLRASGASTIVLVHGLQLFPTAIEDSGLRRMMALAQKFGLPVGYADHVGGDTPAAMWLPLEAIGAGARLIEKHITLDRSEHGTDHYSSLNPEEFARLVTSIREAERALGPQELKLAGAELRYRDQMKKRIVASRDIRAGESLKPEDLVYRRVEGGRGQMRFSEVLGKIANRDIEANGSVRLAELRSKVVAVLACRARSTRLYAKPLQLVGDKPIIVHLIERLRLVSRLDEIVLAISEGRENLAFVDLAESMGLPYVLGEERDVLGRLLKAADLVRADVVIRVTTENPFVYQENVDGMIDHHLTTGADITICEMLPNGSHVEVIGVDVLRRAHKHGNDHHRSELCTLFIFENPDAFRIERLRAPEDVRRPDLCLTVDTPEDLIVARAIYAATARSDGPAPLRDIIKFLDLNPNVRKINQRPPPLKLWP